MMKRQLIMVLKSTTRKYPSKYQEGSAFLNNAKNKMTDELRKELEKVGEYTTCKDCGTPIWIYWMTGRPKIKMDKCAPCFFRTSK